MLRRCCISDVYLNAGFAALVCVVSGFDCMLCGLFVGNVCISFTIRFVFVIGFVIGVWITDLLF